jgi:hypothetical protein
MLDNNTDNRREVYDPDTRYKKIILSALSFNDYLNSSRRQTSKHFLKRKVKAAFEREPIEKGKGFCFNVPFIPNLSMFTPPQPIQPQPTTQTRPATSGAHSSHPTQRQGQGIVSSSTAGTVNINLNQPHKEVEGNQASASTSRNVFNVNQMAQNIPQGQGQGQGHQKQPLMVARPDERRHIPSGENVHTINRQQIPSNIQSSNPNFQTHSSSISFTPQSTQSASINSSSVPQPKYNTQGYTPEQIEAIRQKMLQKHMQQGQGSNITGSNNSVHNISGTNPGPGQQNHMPNTSGVNYNKNPSMVGSNSNQTNNIQPSGSSNIQHNNSANTGTSQNPNSNPQMTQQGGVSMEFIRQQQIKYNKLLEIYKSDPEKLKRDIGPEEFAKFQAILIKSINLKKSQSGSHQGGSNASINNIQQSGQSGTVSNTTNNFVMQSKPNPSG